MARALAGTARASWCSSAAGTCLRNRRTGARKPSGRTCAIAPQEQWLDGDGQRFRPYTHYGVGGNTKFWGSVLYRLRREDFQEIEHADGVSPAWPIDYDTLAPYYDRAERLYHVHGQHGVDPTEPARGPFPYEPIPHSRGMAEIVDGAAAMGLHPSPLPLGLIRPGEEGGCQLCNTCNSFPCRIHAKSDAEVCGIQPALGTRNVDLWTDALAERLLTDGSGARVEAVEVERAATSRRVHAGAVRRVVRRSEFSRVAAALGQRRHATRPRQFLRAGRQALHGASGDDDAGVSPVQEEHTVFQKTVAINDFYL